MAKKDMDLYHSRLTPDDLNNLIKIPPDLHPRLPSEGFMMSELPDDAIGIYHRIFDFLLGPLDLNKVITFEVLCRSLQIEPTKSGFFLIDRWDIPDAMIWRHPDAAIDDPRPAAGSFNMADVRRLSAHFIKLRDMPEGVLVLLEIVRLLERSRMLPTDLLLDVSLKKQVSGLNDKLATSDASFSMSKAKGKEKKKKIKSLSKSLDNLHPEGLVRKFFASDKFSSVQGELLSLTASAGFERGLRMHQTKDEFVDVLKIWLISCLVLRKVLLKLPPSNVPIPRDTRVSHPIAKESTVTPVSKSLKLSANVIPASSVIALEQNQEQGTSHFLDDVAEVTVVGSKHISYGLTDVVVALFAGEKGDGSAPSFTVEEVVVPPYGV
nr:hypothetical protein [Tanacetum cinerariifolium]